MARGKHLFPFRTEQLSPSAPMVLGPQGPGRVGRRRLFVGTGRPSGGPFCVVRRAGRGTRERLGSRPCRRHACELRPLAEADVDGAASALGRAPPRSATAIDPFGEHLPDGPRGAARVRAPSGRPIRLPRAPSSAQSGALVGWFQFEEPGGRPPSASSATGCAPTLGPGLRDRGRRGAAARRLRPAGRHARRTRTRCSTTGSIRVMEKIGMTYAGPWSYRGLPGAEYEAWPRRRRARRGP